MAGDVGCSGWRPNDDASLEMASPPSRESDSSLKSLEGATGGDDMNSAAVYPCREVIRQSEDDLSCPEKPEEQVFIVKAPEGTSQPGVGWPTAPGASLPAFPRVEIGRASCRERVSSVV